MASEVFDRLFLEAWRETQPVCALAVSLLPTYRFASAVDLMRFAATLHGAAQVFAASVAHLVSSRRRDEPVGDESFVVFLIEKTSW